MLNRSSKQEDPQEQAGAIFDAVAPAAEESPAPLAAESKPQKNPAAVALGRLGGIKGGRARAEKLTAEQRKAIAKKAAQKRWGHSAH
jgi:hypothetical protein